MSEPVRDPDALDPVRVDDALVSVVMPAHNTERWIGDSIRAIQAQTHTQWELIVVDDGSSDGTVAAVEALAREDARIRLVRHAGRRGAGAARTSGIAEARGRWLAFQDSDDLWEPVKLERQLAFMRERGAALSAHSYRMVRADLTPTGTPPRLPARVDYARLLGNTIISTITVMIDRTRVGGLSMPDLPQHEDLVLWFSLLRRGWVFHVMPEPYATYRLLHGSSSRDKLRSARRMWRVYRDHLGLTLPQAATCYMAYAVHAAWKYRGVRV